MEMAPAIFLTPVTVPKRTAVPFLHGGMSKRGNKCRGRVMQVAQDGVFSGFLRDREFGTAVALEEA